MTPHVHADLIKAWADGAEIEVQSSTGGTWAPAPNPKWLCDQSYRIKPKPPIEVVDNLRYDPDVGVHFSVSPSPATSVKFTVDPATHKVLSVELVK